MPVKANMNNKLAVACLMTIVLWGGVSNAWAGGHGGFHGRGGSHGHGGFHKHGGSHRHFGLFIGAPLFWPPPYYPYYGYPYRYPPPGGHPGLDRHDLSSLMWLGGGGAAMPEAVARKLETAFGKPYIEGYGLSETMAPTHLNPPHRPKRQCAGIPIFDVDARVLDPDSLAECGPNEVGEIVVHGPQVFQGYWRQPVATAEAFLDHDGKRFFRTGDLGYYDEEGYFFITDRLKRMINASGFKVWPAEVEAMLYAHPDIQEVCVIGVRDPYRGETVKAVVVPTPAACGSLRAQAIIDWARERMATYKVPRAVELVAELPKTATGNVFWRKLQEDEDRRAAGEGAESAS